MRFLSMIRTAAVAVLVLVICGKTLAQPFPRRPAQPVPPGGMPGAPGFVPPGGPAMAPVSPEQFRAEVKTLLTTQPHEAFARLNDTLAFVLAPAERADLAHQAVERLGVRVEVSNNNWATRNEVRTAHQYAASFGPAVVRNVAMLLRLAERRAVSDALFELRHLAEHDRWSETVERGREWRKRLREIEDSPRSELADLVDAGLEQQALATLQEGLRTGDLERVDAAHLPPRLHDAVQGVRGLKMVRTLAAESRLNAREVAALKQNLDAFTKAMRALPEADPSLGAKILQELAVRHLLEGHPQEYRALMPPDGPSDQAARLLRDLKALTAGKGVVVTTPARQMLAEKGAEAPAGVRAVIPESARKGWRPPTRDGERAQPSPLDRAGEISKIIQTRIETDLRSERIISEEKAKKVRGRIEAAQRRLQEREEAEGKRFAEVADVLGRPLEAVDRVRVRLLEDDKHTTRQIVGALRRQADANVPRK